MVGWKIPQYPNGKIISYDVRLKSLGVEQLLLTAASDGTFIPIDKVHQESGMLIQVSTVVATMITFSGLVH